MYRLLIFLLPAILFSQIGINTNSPHLEADLHLGSKNKTLILNRIDDLSQIKDPYEGMIAYDSSERCFKGYQINGWSGCFGDKSADPVVKVNGTGFKGDYIRGKQLTDATYEITISNNTFREVTLGFNITDLEIDQTDITVSAVYISGNTNKTTTQIDEKIPAGSTRTIVYKLNGALNPPYTKIIGLWNKIILSYEDEQEITYKTDCTQGIWTKSLPVEDNGILKNGKTYENFIYTLPIPNSEGYNFEYLEITKDGLTLIREATEGSLNGVLEFKISGTYTGQNAKPVEFANAAGCDITIGRYPYHCKEIINLFPESESGVYTIDLDGDGLNVKPLQAYCDMEKKLLANGTVDNGGWTLVLNYNHLANTSPKLTGRPDSFPILNNKTHGFDESNTDAWGHTTNNLLKYYPIIENNGNQTQLRIFGSSSAHSRVIHFISSNISVTKSFINNETLSYQGIKTNNIKYKNHSGLLPDSANKYSNTIFSHTFYREGFECWNMGTVNNRWEVDNYYGNTNGSVHHTLHQVWIR